MPEVCDICSEPRVDWAYPAEDFGTGAISPTTLREHVSIGTWAMCDPCSTAYEERGVEGIVERAMQSHAHKYADPEIKDALRVALGELYRDFHVRRVGERMTAQELRDTCTHEKYSYMDEEGSAFLPPGYYCERCGQERPTPGRYGQGKPDASLP